MNSLLTIKRAKAICWLDDNTILLYKKNSFYSYNLVQKRLDKFAKMIMNTKQSFFSHFALSRRLFRLYPQSPFLCNITNELFFSFCGNIFCLNLLKKSISNELHLNHGASRVLSICASDTGEVFFGEYPTKNDGLPVCIYKRRAEKEWCVVYKFEAETIRHIHLLSIYANDLYCFTGDEDNQINILCFKNRNFEEQPVVIAANNQKYRTCVASFYNKSLYYLTDNPYFQNKLFRLDLDSNELTEIFNIDGSVIYGFGNTQTHRLYFSTAVEKNLKKDDLNNNVRIPIDGINGGIRSEEARAYCFDFDKSELKKIISLKKDILPIKLFGLGTFTFACNSSDKYLALTSSSLKKNERTFIFNLESEKY